MNKSLRHYNIDIARIVAMFLVVSVHFFLWNGFYSIKMEGAGALIMSVLRTISMSCVPMFLLISGYLLADRNYFPVKIEYYRKLIDLLGMYLVCTAILLVFRIFILKEDFSVKDVVINIFSFSQYSWYVAMYAGLFLIIPFLNLLWERIADRNMQRVLIISLCILTAVPSLINLKTDVFPKDWIGIYPVTYYYIGAYIKKHGDDIRSGQGLLILIWVFSAVVFGCMNYLFSFKGRFAMGIWNDWGSCQNMILSACLFLVIIKHKVKADGEKRKRILPVLSELVYCAFLLSYISDIVAWKIFKDLIPVENKLLAFVPAVALSMALSLIMSYMVNSTKNALIHKCRRKG